MKSLSELLKEISVLEIKGNPEISISSISINSKSISPNSIFIAISGNISDGHDFIDQAIESGAKVIVHQKEIKDLKDNIVYIKVEDTHDASGRLASAFYDHPSEHLRLIGVTGTNGKTTTTTLLHQLFMNLGQKAGLIGTVVNKINNKSFEAERTTPDPITLNKTLRDMVEAGCDYCFIEVSSHSVALKRISGLFFSGGVFTNLTLDHLDFHKTFEDYRDAKKAFFDSLSPDVFALSNIDDQNGEYMLSATRARKYYYGLKTETDFNERLETKLIGEFNAYNTLAVYATAVLLDEDRGKVREEIKNLDPVPGRFQYVKSTNNITGIVDYAHTPDALENVLKTVNEMKGNNKVISVFGCGGDRDKTKRPIMAKIGYDMSDIVILTSDNPRTEKPEDILIDMKNGLTNEFESKVHIIVDRKEAIKKAVEFAKEGDYILLAGKGHENYQEVNGIKSHFDDLEEIQKTFNE